MTIKTCLSLLALLPACLDPLVSDEVEHPELILPPGTELPELTDDPIARAALDRADQQDDDLIELRSAFAHGQRIWYWDMGVASPAPIPLYLLVEPSDQGFFETPRGRFAPVADHPPIFDAVPGDAGYSPWWIVVLWPVTERYHGEVLGSFAAMDEAFRQGLVGPSITLPTSINCPVILPEARLEMMPGDPASAIEPTEAYYKGTEVYYFTFDTLPLNALDVSVAPLYVLRREGGEPLSEAERGVDITHDGDTLDSNDLFSAIQGDPVYSGMVELIDAVVVDAALIDRSQSDAESALMDAAELFADGTPDPTKVVALHPQGVIVNRPIRPPPNEEE